MPRRAVTMQATDPTLELRTAAADADAPPPVLLPYQQAWVADDAQVKVCEKGRRTGMTWAEAADDVLIAASERGSKVFYISATEDMAREYIEACAMWARAFHHVASAIGDGLYDDGEDEDGNRRQFKMFEIGFPRSGHRIVALSSRPKNLRGKQGVIVIDEAAFHDDLDAMVKAAMAMTIWGDKIRIISTHLGMDSAFNELITDIRAGEMGGPEVASVHRVPFMDAVQQGLYRRVCMRTGKTWTQQGEDDFVKKTYGIYRRHHAEELDVVPSASRGAYLSLALIEQRMVPTWPSNPDGPALVRGEWDDAFAYLADDVRTYAIKGWIAEEVQPHLARLQPLRRHAFGSDFARSGDLTVLTVLEEDVDLRRRVRLVIELRNCPFTSQDQIFEHVIRALPRFRGGAMDATGNGAATAERMAQIFGALMVEQVKLSQPFYVAHMPKLKVGLQDDTVHGLPRDERCRDDLRAIKLVQGVPLVPRKVDKPDASGERGDDDKQRHGDFAISLFLAVYAFHREAGEIAWTPVPDRASRWDGGGDPRRDDLVGADFDRKGGW